MLQHQDPILMIVAFSTCTVAVLMHFAARCIGGEIVIVTLTHLFDIYGERYSQYPVA